MRYTIVLVCTALLGGCGIFSSDATPAIQNQMALREIAIDALDAGAKLVAESDLEESKKVLVLDEIRRGKDQYLELADQQIEYLEGLGEINWKTLAKEAYQLYQEYRSK